MRTVCVQSEFTTLRTAVMHDGRNAIDISMADYEKLVPPEDLRKHPEAGPSSKARLFEQHARFRQLLADEGVALISPTTDDTAFCQVFTRDPCFVIGNTLFVGELRDEWRHPETTGLQRLRSEVERVVTISANGATVEGGDVMVLDQAQRVLVGTNEHTNAEGIRQLTAALPGVEMIAVPHRALHLDCCLAPLPNGEAVYAAEKLPESSVTLLQKVFRNGMTPLDTDEAGKYLAANVFWVDERRVVSSTTAERTNALLRTKGYEVFELDFSDLVALWGSFRCVVCPLERW